MLLGDPPPRNDTAPKLERAWFVDGCPLEPNDAVEAIRKRHGFGSRTDALRALRNARTELREAKHPDAKVMGDLP